MQRSCNMIPDTPENNVFLRKQSVEGRGPYSFFKSGLGEQSKKIHQLRFFKISSCTWRLGAALQISDWEILVPARRPRHLREILSTNWEWDLHVQLNLQQSSYEHKEGASTIQISDNGRFLCLQEGLRDKMKYCRQTESENLLAELNLPQSPWAKSRPCTLYSVSQRLCEALV